MVLLYTKCNQRNIPFKGGMCGNRKIQKARKIITLHEELDFRSLVLLKKGCHTVWDMSLI